MELDMVSADMASDMELDMVSADMASDMKLDMASDLKTELN